MDASVIKKTQDTLGKVIKKPPLTDKLLSKPPFRFLHDILTEVIKNTGVLKGLYKSDEMNSENVKDKEAKMTFLQKAIDCVGIMTGEALGARPSKIVAGHEPEKTNEFLQALGKACLKKMDSSDAVKKTLSGDKPSSGKSRKKESSRTSSKERLKDEKEKSKDKKEEKDGRKRDDKKERESSSKDRDSSRKGREEKERNSAKEKDKVLDKGKDKEKEKPKEKEKKKETVTKAPEPEVEMVNENNEKVSPEPANGDAENEDEGAGNRTIQRPSSAKGQRRRPTNSETDKDERIAHDDGIQDSTPKEDNDDNGRLDDEPPLRQVSAVRRPARPSSARPAPPKIKRNDEIEESAPRLGSGKPMNAAVIVDNGKDQDDEDDLFVVEDGAQNDPYLEEPREDSQIEVDDGQHGSLVKKMLDSKREAEIQSKSSNQNKEKPIIIDATRKKEKEIAQKEIEKLRNSIQTLCRSAHPLGKIMDYLQEDIDSMQKELEVWKKDNKKYALALKAEQSITESEVEPLHAQLDELELEITDMVDRISSVKSNIIRNDEKIRDMISGVSR